MVEPEQTAATCVKVGVTFGFTVIVIAAVDAHCHSFGVNMYVVVAVLSKAGDQVPVIPSIEVVGKAAKLDPEHIGTTSLKVGVVDGRTSTVISPVEVGKH